MVPSKPETEIPDRNQLKIRNKPGPLPAYGGGMTQRNGDMGLPVARNKAAKDSP